MHFCLRPAKRRVEAMRAFSVIFLGFLLLLLSTAFTDGDKVIPKTLKGKFVWIDSGQVELNRAGLKIRGFELGANLQPELKQVPSFFISKFEVSNFEYMEFLKDLKSKGELNLYNSIIVDSTAWVNHVDYAQRYVEYYHSHPAYYNYPVVNVSYKGAKAYCEWLTAQFADSTIEGKKISFRLPTREEWLRAARADNHGFKYSWGQTDPYDKKGAKKCNFKEYNSDEIKDSDQHNLKAKNRVVVGTMNRLRSSVSVTMQVKSFDANEFGLYNLNGNVAEMIDERNVALGGSWANAADEVTLESELEYEAPSPLVGFRPVMIVTD